MAEQAVPEQRMRIRLWGAVGPGAHARTWVSLYPLDADTWTDPVASVQLEPYQEIPDDLAVGAIATVTGRLDGKDPVQVRVGDLVIRTSGHPRRKVSGQEPLGVGSYTGLHHPNRRSFGPDRRPEKTARLRAGATPRWWIVEPVVSAVVLAALIVASLVATWFGHRMQVVWYGVPAGLLVALRIARRRLRARSGITHALHEPQTWPARVVVWRAPNPDAQTDGSVRNLASVYPPDAPPGAHPLATVLLAEPGEVDIPYAAPCRVHGKPGQDTELVIDVDGERLMPDGPVLPGVEPARSYRGCVDQDGGGDGSW